MSTDVPDNDFDFYLRFAKPLVLNLSEPDDRVLAAAWIQKLRNEAVGDLRLRTDYLKLLLFVLQRKQLIGTFAENPNNYDQLTGFPEYKLHDVAKQLLQSEEQLRNAGVANSSGDFPPYSTEHSADLLEYSAAQDIPNFGVHAYYAISNEPLTSWSQAEKAVFPRGAASAINKSGSKQVTPSGVSVTTSAPSLDASRRDKSYVHSSLRTSKSKSPIRTRSKSPKDISPSKRLSLKPTPPPDRSPPTWGSNLIAVSEPPIREMTAGIGSKVSDEEGLGTDTFPSFPKSDLPHGFASPFFMENPPSMFGMSSPPPLSPGDRFPRKRLNFRDDPLEDHFEPYDRMIADFETDATPARIAQTTKGFCAPCSSTNQSQFPTAERSRSPVYGGGRPLGNAPALSNQPFKPTFTCGEVNAFYVESPPSFFEQSALSSSEESCLPCSFQRSKEMNTADLSLASLPYRTPPVRQNYASDFLQQLELDIITDQELTNAAASSGADKTPAKEGENNKPTSPEPVPAPPQAAAPDPEDADVQMPLYISSGSPASQDIVDAFNKFNESMQVQHILNTTDSFKQNEMQYGNDEYMQQLANRRPDVPATPPPFRKHKLHTEDESVRYYPEQFGVSRGMEWQPAEDYFGKQSDLSPRDLTRRSDVHQLMLDQQLEEEYENISVSERSPTAEKYETQRQIRDIQKELKKLKESLPSEGGLPVTTPRRSPIPKRPVTIQVQHEGEQIYFDLPTFDSPDELFSESPPQEYYDSPGSSPQQCGLSRGVQFSPPNLNQFQGQDGMTAFDAAGVEEADSRISPKASCGVCPQTQIFLASSRAHSPIIQAAAAGPSPKATRIQSEEVSILEEVFPEMGFEEENIQLSPSRLAREWYLPEYAPDVVGVMDESNQGILFDDENLPSLSPKKSPTPKSPSPIKTVSHQTSSSRPLAALFEAEPPTDLITESPPYGITFSPPITSTAARGIHSGPRSPLSPVESPEAFRNRLQQVNVQQFKPKQHTIVQRYKKHPTIVSRTPVQPNLPNVREIPEYFDDEHFEFSTRVEKPHEKLPQNNRRIRIVEPNLDRVLESPVRIPNFTEVDDVTGFRKDREELERKFAFRPDFDLIYPEDLYGIEGQIRPVEPMYGLLDTSLPQNLAPAIAPPIALQGWESPPHLRIAPRTREIPPPLQVFPGRGKPGVLPKGYQRISDAIDQERMPIDLNFSPPPLRSLKASISSNFQTTSPLGLPLQNHLPPDIFSNMFQMEATEFLDEEERPQEFYSSPVASPHSFPKAQIDPRYIKYGFPTQKGAYKHQRSMQIPLGSPILEADEEFFREEGEPFMANVQKSSGRFPKSKKKITSLKERVPRSYRRLKLYERKPISPIRESPMRVPHMFDVEDTTGFRRIREEIEQRFADLPPLPQDLPEDLYGTEAAMYWQEGPNILDQSLPEGLGSPMRPQTNIPGWATPPHLKKRQKKRSPYKLHFPSTFVNILDQELPPRDMFDFEEDEYEGPFVSVPDEKVKYVDAELPAPDFFYSPPPLQKNRPETEAEWAKEYGANFFENLDMENMPDYFDDAEIALDSFLSEEEPDVIEVVQDQSGREQIYEKTDFVPGVGSIYELRDETLPEEMVPFHTRVSDTQPHWRKRYKKVSSITGRMPRSYHRINLKQTEVPGVVYESPIGAQPMSEYDDRTGIKHMREQLEKRFADLPPLPPEMQQKYVGTEQRVQWEDQQGSPSHIRGWKTPPHLQKKERINYNVPNLPNLRNRAVYLSPPWPPSPTTSPPDSPLLNAFLDHETPPEFQSPPQLRTPEVFKRSPQFLDLELPPDFSHIDLSPRSAEEKEIITKLSEKVSRQLMQQKGYQKPLHQTEKMQLCGKGSPCNFYDVTVQSEIYKKQSPKSTPQNLPPSAIIKKAGSVAEKSSPDSTLDSFEAHEILVSKKQPIEEEDTKQPHSVALSKDEQEKAKALSKKVYQQLMDLEEAPHQYQRPLEYIQTESYRKQSPATRVQHMIADIPDPHIPRSKPLFSPKLGRLTPDYSPKLPQVPQGIDLLDDEVPYEYVSPKTPSPQPKTPPRLPARNIFDVETGDAEFLDQIQFPECQLARSPTSPPTPPRVSDYFKPHTPPSPGTPTNIKEEIKEHRFTKHFYDKNKQLIVKKVVIKNRYKPVHKAIGSDVFTIPESEEAQESPVINKSSPRPIIKRTTTGVKESPLSTSTVITEEIEEVIEDVPQASISSQRTSPRASPKPSNYRSSENASIPISLNFVSPPKPKRVVIPDKYDYLKRSQTPRVHPQRDIFSRSVTESDILDMSFIPDDLSFNSISTPSDLSNFSPPSGYSPPSFVSSASSQQSSISHRSASPHYPSSSSLAPSSPSFRQTIIQKARVPQPRWEGRIVERPTLQNIEEEPVFYRAPRNPQNLQQYSLPQPVYYASPGRQYIRTPISQRRPPRPFVEREVIEEYKEFSPRQVENRLPFAGMSSPQILDTSPIGEHLDVSGLEEGMTGFEWLG